MTAVEQLAPPQAPGSLPLLGHSWALYRDPTGFLRSLHRGTGVVELRIGRRPVYLIAHRDLVRQVLGVDYRRYDKGGQFFEVARAVAGNGLATCSHADHQVQRPLVQPAFHPSAIADYAPAVSAAISRYVDSWRPGQTLHMEPEMLRLSIEVLTNTLFRDPRILPAAAEVEQGLPTIIHGLRWRIAMPSFLARLPLRANRAFDDSLRRTRAAIARAVDVYRTGGTRPDDLLSRLVDAGDQSSETEVSRDELIDQAVTLFLTGVETTAAALTTFFYLLSTHPEVESRLREELATQLDGHSPGFADLSRLPYLHRVITETLRLYPPGWFFTRTTSTATDLGGYQLPAGADVMISTYCLHRAPDVFPDPDTFDPDRWLPTRAGRQQRDALIPFSLGRRRCIGENFATTELARAAAIILCRFRLRIAPGTRPTIPPRVILQPRNLHMIAEPRA